ncbi:hypothetical protein HZB78_02865 [Candidatus Collierbacteria bacterium]|nr:hypothetical protein [Candidatus Collierbacteria bacterium]
MRPNRRTIIFDLATGVLINISSGWFGVVLITPVFTAPVLDAENVWFLTKGIFFGMISEQVFKDIVTSAQTSSALLLIVILLLLMAFIKFPSSNNSSASSRR